MGANDMEHELNRAKALARTTWSRIQRYYMGDFEITDKEDGPATDADREANDVIVEALEKDFPGDGILSEEAEASPDRFDRDRVWIVDPIDGTNDFIDQTGNFAIQIGLSVRTEEGYVPRVGVVYHPPEGNLYYASHGAGAWVEAEDGSKKRLRVSDTDEIESMRVVATRSHRSPLFTKILEAMRPREIITMGSLGLKVAWIATDQADYYVNNARGMCKEWDICAPEAILAESGGHMTDLNGAPFRYNQKDVRLREGILASNGRGHDGLVSRFLEAEKEIVDSDRAGRE